jgi:hypothetical protein
MEADASVMSLDTYNSLMETLHLLRSPANAARLQLSLAQAERGELVEQGLGDSSLGGLSRLARPGSPAIAAHQPVGSSLSAGSFRRDRQAGTPARKPGGMLILACRYHDG